jgi:hypothetical protein
VGSPRTPNGTLDPILPEARKTVARRSPKQAEHPFDFHHVLGLLPRHQPHGSVRIVGTDAVVDDGAADILWK